MQTLNITIIAGARPNFMKIAPIIKAIEEQKKQGYNFSYRLVHTGQHYDKAMSGDFFEQLGIPAPHANLECGGGTQAEQTGAIMVKIEKELTDNRPDIMLVVGDVTSTMACTITAKKLGITVGHVEAGIRSGDMSMPEEINRIVTDSICDYFFTTSETANQQLLENNIDADHIHFVGNTMIDTLLQQIGHCRRPVFADDLELQEKNYYLLTLHRPSNVDDPQKLTTILQAIRECTNQTPIIFPVHPRTQKMLETHQIQITGFHAVPPQSYLEFIYLIKQAKGIITDSGGITEEATVLNIPCLTMRNSTERPETITMGTNELIGDDLDKLKSCLAQIHNNEWKKGAIPPLWDGKTADRIVSALIETFAVKRN